jgi:hypothetical protein
VTDADRRREELTRTFIQLGESIARGRQFDPDTIDRALTLAGVKRLRRKYGRAAVAAWLRQLADAEEGDSRLQN